VTVTLFAREQRALERVQDTATSYRISHTLRHRKRRDKAIAWAVTELGLPLRLVGEYAGLSHTRVDQIAREQAA
jgi:hypothetical protein